MSPQHHDVGWRFGPFPYSSQTPSLLGCSHSLPDNWKSSKAILPAARTVTILPLYRSGCLAMSHTPMFRLAAFTCPVAAEGIVMRARMNPPANLPITEIIARFWPKGAFRKLRRWCSGRSVSANPTHDHSPRREPSRTQLTHGRQHLRSTARHASLCETPTRILSRR